LVVRQREYKIVGIDCASCAKTLENDLKGLTGVEDSRVNITNKMVYITYQPELISDDALKKRIQKSGYTVLELVEEKIQRSFRVSS